MFLERITVFLALANLGLCRVFIVDPPPEPPQPDETAKMARYIMRNSDWISLATISTQNTIHGYPFVNLVSVSDGPPPNSTGIPYMYMTPFDMSAQDLHLDSRCSILATLAQSDYCQRKNLDPEDPRCAKLMITGKMVQIDKASPEYDYGLNAIYAKHPLMKTWPEDHLWYVTKVDIEQVVVMDFFGGPKYVSTQDYFNANDTTVPGDIPVNNVVIDVTEQHTTHQIHSRISFK